MADHLEIEQKFDADQDFERPDFAAVTATAGVTAAAPVVHRLSATYFDTADGRLQAAKITLRRRTGGSDAGWHLKLPADGPLPGAAPLADGVSARRELQEPLECGGSDGADAPVVPARLASRVAEVAGGLPLAPIAILVTERTVVTLTSADGTLLAEIADDQVTARRLPETSAEPLRWREIEVEVPVADPQLQQAVADRLLAAGARPAGHGSKLARLLSALSERMIK
jgi:inorganic triphosphatase YgiF